MEYQFDIQVTSPIGPVRVLATVAVDGEHHHATHESPEEWPEADIVSLVRLLDGERIKVADISSDDVDNIQTHAIEMYLDGDDDGYDGGDDEE